MNRYEVDRLQAVRGYPALTITLPTHRSAPANRQDPIRVKNLLDEATERLTAQLPKADAAALVGRLRSLVDELDFEHLLDGLAIFVHAEYSRAVLLPFALRERVVLAETFFTRDVVLAMNRTHRYWVLVLSEKPTRLLEGTRDTLLEVEEHGFPLVHEGPGGSEPLPRGEGVNTSGYRDDAHRRFFRQVDAAFKTVYARDSLPLVVVGVERYLSFFREVSEHESAILTTVAGSHDRTSPHELSRLVWPRVEEALARERTERLHELERAVGERRAASALDEVWRAAGEGRGRLLLVEESFHQPARLRGNRLEPLRAPVSPELAAEPEYLEDAVDEIIEAVRAHGGEAVFLEDGSLAAHQRLALILRY